MISSQYINTACVGNDWKAQELRRQGKTFEQCIRIETGSDGRFYAYLGAHGNSNMIGAADSKREAKKGARAWFNSI